MTACTGLEPLAVTVAEAARLLSQSETWIKEEIAAGRLVSVKRGRSRRIRMDDLRAFNAARDDSRVTRLAPPRRRRHATRSVDALEDDGPMPLMEYAEGGR